MTFTDLVRKRFRRSLFFGRPAVTGAVTVGFIISNPTTPLFALWILVGAPMTPATALAAPGDLDPTFGIGGKVSTPLGSGYSQANALIRQPDGRLVAAGRASTGDKSTLALVRYTADGRLDPTFGSGGMVTTPLSSSDARAYALVLQPDGKLVAAGTTATHGQLVLLRYATDGQPDATFGSGGRATAPGSAGDATAYALVRQPDGKLVAAGSTLVQGKYHFALVRYTPNGHLDHTFGTGGQVTTLVGGADQINALVIQPDGKLVAAGNVTEGGGRSDFVLVRYGPDGRLDQTFGAHGKATTQVSVGFAAANALVLQPDGNLVAAGYTDPDGHFVLVRYTSNGRLDPTFGMNGISEVGSAGAVNALVRQPDGKLVAAGDAPRSNRELSEGGFPKTDFVLVRYTSDGRLDPTFGTGGRVSTTLAGSSGTAYALIVQPDGKLVAAGSALESGKSDFALVRYVGGDGPDVPSASSGR